jgi:lantibiotic transport system ATP-binding protein
MASVISTQSLTRRFGELVAVDQLSLEVPEGQVYGFLGPNGSGKTTTIRMLLGLILPNCGEIQIFGKTLGNSRREILSKIGALVESPSLYNHLSGRDNLEITRRLVGAPKTSIDRVFELAGIAPASEQLVKTYSLGMKQRLGLALALLNNPRLLILDEPTNGLDPAGIREMRQLICALPKETGITIFLSSHMLHEVEQMANTVGIINKGKILYQGTIAELNQEKELRLHLKVDKPAETLAFLQLHGYPQAALIRDAVELNIATGIDSAVINKLLVNNGFDVLELRFSHVTLEHRFLELTGQTEQKEAT